MRAKFLLLLTLIVIGGCIQDMFLRPAFDTPYYPDQFGYEYKEVDIPYGDQYVSIWHIYSQESKALVVVIPGSDANKSRYTEASPLFIDNGIDLILMDYPGFGTSPGDKSLDNCMHAAHEVVKYALNQHKNVFIYGVSLGAPIATYIASEEEVSGVILEAPLVLNDEVEFWIDDNLPVVNLLDMLIEPLEIVDFSTNWVRFQTPVEYNIIWWIRFVDEPKLFIHSVEDDVTPYRGGLEVFERAKQPKQFWTVYGGHGKMVELEPYLWSQVITSWIKSR